MDVVHDFKTILKRFYRGELGELKDVPQKIFHNFEDQNIDNFPEKGCMWKFWHNQVNGLIIR